MSRSIFEVQHAPEMCGFHAVAYWNATSPATTELTLALITDGSSVPENKAKVFDVTGPSPLTLNVSTEDLHTYKWNVSVDARKSTHTPAGYEISDVPQDFGLEIDVLPAPSCRALAASTPEP